MSKGTWGKFAPLTRNSLKPAHQLLAILGAEIRASTRTFRLLRQVLGLGGGSCSMPLGEAVERWFDGRGLLMRALQSSDSYYQWQQGVQEEVHGGICGKLDA